MPRVLWYKLCGQQFSCGMIDIVESMSCRLFLTTVCAPPSASFFLNFYDVTLPNFRIDSCVDVYVLYDYSDISTPLFDYRITLRLFWYLDEIASLKCPVKF